MTIDQERNLRGLLDCAIPECRPKREFFINLRKYGVEIAMKAFARHGIKDEVYWRHAQDYMRSIGLLEE